MFLTVGLSVNHDATCAMPSKHRSVVRQRPILSDMAGGPSFLPLAGWFRRMSSDEIDPTQQRTYLAGSQTGNHPSVLRGSRAYTISSSSRGAVNRLIASVSWACLHKTVAAEHMPLLAA